MTTVLIITCGHTDVQLVGDNGKRAFGKDHVGRLHDQLRDNPGAWMVVDAPTERDGDVSEFPVPRPWRLCTPKLDAVLSWLDPSRPDRVLLLETTRAKAKDDPRFAGGVLERRARECGVTNVTRCAYLQSDDRHLEDRNTPVDAIVRRTVVRRIEEAIRESLKGAIRVIVATSGGMPEVKALVRDLTRLHVSSEVEPEIVEVDDGAQRNEPDRVVPRMRFDPVEAIRLRKQSLVLVGKGNLLGAYGSVAHLRTEDHPWATVFEWLACFASSLPTPGDCDIPILKHAPLAAHAALRVELALLADDIPRAVHGTMAFCEAALWDWFRQRNFLSEDGATGSLKDGFTFSPQPTGEAKKRFRHRKELGRWKIDDFKDGVAAWLPVLAKPALTAIWGALSEDIRELRNDVAHNEPTPDLMDGARTRMRTVALWSDTDTFLSQPLVQAVLRELSVEKPELLCSNLLKEVRDRLLAPS